PREPGLLLRAGPRGDAGVAGQVRPRRCPARVGEGGGHALKQSHSHASPLGIDLTLAGDRKDRLTEQASVTNLAAVAEAGPDEPAIFARCQPDGPPSERP